MTKCRISWCKEDTSDARTGFCKQHKVVSDMLLMMVVMYFGCVFTIFGIPLAFKDSYFGGIFISALATMAFSLTILWTFIVFKKMKQMRIETEAIPNGA